MNKKKQNLNGGDDDEPLELGKIYDLDANIEPNVENTKEEEINSSTSDGDPSLDPNKEPEINNSQPTDGSKIEEPIPSSKYGQVAGKNNTLGSKLEAGGDIKIGDTYKEFKQSFSTSFHFYNNEEEEGRLFSIQSWLTKLDIQALHKETDDDVATFNPIKLGELKFLLLETRIIIIHGEADLGKAFLGKKLASLLVKNGKAKKIYKSKPLLKKLNIDLSGFLESEPEIENSILIFENFLEHNNNSIKQLFLSLKPTTIKNLLQTSLAKLDSYLIFTSDTEFCSEIVKSVVKTKIAFELEAPSQELLSTAFDKIQQKAIRDISVKREFALTIEDILQKNKDYIIISLGKIGAIAKFIESIIYKAKKRKNSVINQESIELELDRLTSLSEWFASELRESEILWFWTISFTICQCKPGNPGVPVPLFEVIRREILHHLKEEDLTQTENLEFTILRSEESYIEKCQAEVYNHFTTNARHIRFKDHNFKEKVFATLFKYYLTSISRIFDIIGELADHKDHKIRNFVAIMLGRLSEGFPEKTKDILQNWAINSSKQYQVGYFYQGLWAVPNKKHRDRFINTLELMAQSGSQDKTLSKQQNQKIHSAIRGYTELGPYLLKSTLKTFGIILENRLGKQTEAITKMTKSLEKFELFAAEKIHSFEDAIKHEAIQLIGRSILESLFEEKKEDFGIAIHIQYAISHLCVVVDTATVFKELNKWILKGSNNLQILLTHLFLDSDGIADILNRFSIKISEESSDNNANLNPIVYSLLSGEAAVRSIATYLNRMMDSLYLLPLQPRRLYRQYLFFHLRHWVKNSLQLPLETNPMVDLYVEFMLTSKEMENEIKFDMEYHFTQSKKELFAFKKAVQKNYYRAK